MPLLIAEACARHWVEQIYLVHRFNKTVLAGLIKAELTEDFQHITALCLAVRVRRVANMDNNVGFGDFFEGGPKGGDQVGRKIGDKADRVGEDCLASRRQ